MPKDLHIESHLFTASEVSMKAASNFPPLFRISTLLVVVSLLSLNTPAKTDLRSANGIVSVFGTVEINGQRSMNGQTIFDRARVVTGRGSESFIALSNFARLNVGAETELIIDFSARRITGSLPSGRVTAQVPLGVSLDFQTVDLSIASDATELVTFTIESSECDGTRISVTSGNLVARTRGRTLNMKAGETLSTESGLTPGSPLPQSLSGKKKIGIFAAIGGAVAILLAVALGQNDQDQASPGEEFGCCTLAPSPR